MLVACNDFVLVKFHDAAKVTDGGIILPDTASPRETVKATVMAFGPEARKGNSFEIGYNVVVNGYPQRFVVDGVEYAAVRGSDIVCVVG